MSEKILEVNDVARRLRVSPDTVRRWCEGGAFPNALDVGTRTKRHWRIPEGDLERVRVFEGTPADLEAGTLI